MRTHIMIEFNIEENNTKTFETALDTEMINSIKHFEGELIKIRTGRANTAMIEDIKVACYGQAPMPLKTLAVLGAPDSRLLTIQPWDASIIQDIEKAISESGLGLAPENDGKIIRLRLPEMSTSRREELVKILHKRLEECKISIRNIRKIFNNIVRDHKKDKKISEDFSHRLDDSLKKITDKFTDKAEQLCVKKEQEIRSF